MVHSVTSNVHASRGDVNRPDVKAWFYERDINCRPSFSFRSIENDGGEGQHHIQTHELYLLHSGRAGHLRSRYYLIVLVMLLLASLNVSLSRCREIRSAESKEVPLVPSAIPSRADDRRVLHGRRGLLYRGKFTILTRQVNYRFYKILEVERRRVASFKSAISIPFSLTPFVSFLFFLDR